MGYMEIERFFYYEIVIKHPRLVHFTLLESEEKFFSKRESGEIIKFFVKKIDFLHI